MSSTIETLKYNTRPEIKILSINHTPNDDSLTLDEDTIEYVAEYMFQIHGAYWIDKLTFEFELIDSDDIRSLGCQTCLANLSQEFDLEENYSYKSSISINGLNDEEIYNCSFDYIHVPTAVNEFVILYKLGIAHLNVIIHLQNELEITHSDLDSFESVSLIVVTEAHNHE